MFFVLCLCMLIIATLYMGWRVYNLDLKKKMEKDKAKLEKNKAPGIKRVRNQNSNHKDIQMEFLDEEEES